MTKWANGATNCDRCNTVGLNALPVCTVCDRDICKQCECRGSESGPRYNLPGLHGESARGLP
jgi:hypothetical protein